MPCGASSCAHPLASALLTGLAPSGSGPLIRASSIYCSDARTPIRNSMSARVQVWANTPEKQYEAEIARLGQVAHMSKCGLDVSGRCERQMCSRCTTRYVLPRNCIQVRHGEGKGLGRCCVDPNCSGSDVWPRRGGGEPTCAAETSLRESCWYEKKKKKSTAADRGTSCTYGRAI